MEINSFIPLHFPFLLLILLSSSEFKLREAFINQSQEFYESTPQNLTSDPEANVKLVNDWVATKTQNRIKKLVDSLDESADLVLLNAVYFIGQWPCFHICV